MGNGASSSSQSMRSSKSFKVKPLEGPKPATEGAVISAQPPSVGEGSQRFAAATRREVPTNWSTAIPVAGEEDAEDLRVTLTGSANVSSGDRYAAPGDVIEIFVKASRPLRYPVSGVVVQGGEHTVAEPAGMAGRQWLVTHTVTEADPVGPIYFWIRADGRDTPVGGPNGCPPLRGLVKGQLRPIIIHPPKLHVSMDCANGTRRATVGEVVRLTVQAYPPLSKPATGWVVSEPDAADPEDLEGITNDGGRTWTFTHKVRRGDPPGLARFAVQHNEFPGRDAKPVQRLSDLQKPVEVYFASATPRQAPLSLIATMQTDTGKPVAGPGDTIILRVAASRPLEYAPSASLVRPSDRRTMQQIDADGHEWEVTRPVTRSDPEGPVAWSVEHREADEDRSPLKRLKDDAKPVEIAQPAVLGAEGQGCTNKDSGIAGAGEQVWVDLRTSKRVEHPPRGVVVPGSAEEEATPRDASGTLWRLSHTVEPDDPEGPVEFVATLADGSNKIDALPAGVPAVKIEHPAQLRCTMECSNGTRAATKDEFVWIDVVSTKPLPAGLVGVIGTNGPHKDVVLTAGIEDSEGREWRVRREVTEDDVAGPIQFWVAPCDPAVAGRVVEPKVTSLAPGESAVTVYFDAAPVPPPKLLPDMSCSNGTMRATTGDKVVLDIASDRGLTKPPTAWLVTGSDDAAWAAAVPFGAGADDGTTWRIEHTVTSDDPEGPCAFGVQHNEPDFDSAPISQLANGAQPVHITFEPVLAVAMSSSSGDGRATAGDTVYLDVTSSKPLTAPPTGILLDGDEVAAEAGGGGGTSWRFSRLVTEEDPAGPVPFVVHSNEEGYENARVTQLGAGQEPVVVYFVPTITTAMQCSNGTVQAAPGDAVEVIITSSRPLTAPPTGSLFHGGAETVAQPVGSDGKTWRLTAPLVSVETAEGEVPFWVRTHEGGVDGPKIETLSDGQVRVAVVQPKLPDDYKMTLEVADVQYWEVTMSWPAVPLRKPEDIEYRFTFVDDGDDPYDAPDSHRYIQDGDNRQFVCDEYNGEPVNPGEDFKVMVEFRDRADGLGPSDGWRGASDPMIIMTKPLEEGDPVELLLGRFPRLYMREPIEFKKNSDEIVHGMEAIPQVAEIMKHQDDTMTLSVEGHVNFGQKDKKAKALSLARAKMVVSQISALGVDKGRMKTKGFGHTRTRYPRGHANAYRNRRVELRVLSGKVMLPKVRDSRK